MPVATSEHLGREFAQMIAMPKRSTTQKARRIQKKGRRASTAAGPFVREEMRKRKRRKGARSRKQAVAIGLSKARRAGIAVKKKGTAKKGTAKRRAASRSRRARKAPVRRKRTQKRKAGRKTTRR
jgi:hypothetical protein